MQYGLIGKKLGHSYSKDIHQKIGGYEYELLEIPQERLADFFAAKEFSGINVTIPYKEQIIPFLDFIDEDAQKIGAVNTVVKRDGKLCGYNTDFGGLTALIKRAGIEVKGKKALVLGTGGTSKTAAAVAQSLGAAEIYKVSRSGRDGAITYEEALQSHAEAQVILNTTPSGMFPNGGGKPLDICAFKNLSGLVDVIYNPLRTNLVLDGEQRGVAATGGLYMLVAQAVLAAELFTGQKIAAVADNKADNKIEEIYKSLVQEKQSLVLIGMPASGKTTVGKICARLSGKNFIDTDALIVEKIKMPIPQYFEQFGEKSFRAVEKEVVAEVSQKSGCVISTGGGSVLDAENVRALKRNGRLFFLDRALQNLIATRDRPLSSDAEKLRGLYETRLPIYKKCADFEIDGNYSPDEVAKKIMEVLSK